MGDPRQRCPDISRVKNLLDWGTKTDFGEGLKKSIEDFRNRLKNKTKVLVFVPVFLPFEGPVETAVKEIANRMPGYEFDVITTSFKKGVPAEEKIGRFNIYRIGMGNDFDKFILPFVAPFKALSLHKKNNYQAAWGVMASYGALAGVLFSYLTRVALLVSLFEGKIKDSESSFRKMFKPIYKIIFRRAHRMQVVAELPDEQLAWLEDDKKIQAIDMAKGWDFVAKKTKEQFQELEILTSRL